MDDYLLERTEDLQRRLLVLANKHVNTAIALPWYSRESKRLLQRAGTLIDWADYNKVELERLRNS